jgi:hypothetical protein
MKTKQSLLLNLSSSYNHSYCIEYAAAANSTLLEESSISHADVAAFV